MRDNTRFKFPKRYKTHFVCLLLKIPNANCINLYLLVITGLVTISFIAISS